MVKANVIKRANRIRKKKGLLNSLFGKKEKGETFQITESSEIGIPFDFKHEMKVTVDSETGKLKGVPKEWEKIIKEAGLTVEELEQNADLIDKSIGFIEGKKAKKNNNNWK